ncbi:uncharacterized protein STEHIDRAFT_121994, partial [Stereum hirsutum FP-91666 SS1]|uniref:uncharacterized protein n=1 Tax=Stereum hirsutum (strain FP-91666) TaxID=721885 RepID=UPI000444A352
MSPVDEHDNEHDNSQSQAHSPTESDSGYTTYPVRRRATAVFAKDWQLRALKRLYMQTARPTEAQKRVAAAETGLDTRWIGSWFQRQNNPNRKGSLAHQAMCDAKTAHAQGHGPPSKQPAHRSSSMPSHPGPHAFTHNTFSSINPDFATHMSTAEYHDHLRRAEMERQRREALLQHDGERVPRTLIGPGIHPSMFPERRSSSSSLSRGGSGPRPCKD